jgi:saccharopine dehydrogenase-like NADP-dependent oxidoreductase
MKLFCLGGAGKIAREAVRDVVEFTGPDLFEKITIGDVNAAAGESLAHELQSGNGDGRVDFRRVNVLHFDEAVDVLREYDVVMDGTGIALNDRTTACISFAGCSGVNLNGFGEEYKYDGAFRDRGRLFVPGFGMTPGLTDMMVRNAADRLDTVDVVRVSHGAFRPIAFSPAIFETTSYEYDPDLPGRVVYEDGKFLQVPPFSRERVIDLPEPYGSHPQWIIPHAETRTVVEYLKDKGVRLVEVRGTWPPKSMVLVRALYEWGFFRNGRFRFRGREMGIMEVLGAYLVQSPEGTTADLYGYALHVEVTGTRSGRAYRHVLTHTHPPSDGSVEGWEGLSAYTRNVGIPLSVAAAMIARGEARGKGVVIPERAFEPASVFGELEKRGIVVHEKVERC